MLLEHSVTFSDRPTLLSLKNILVCGKAKLDMKGIWGGSPHTDTTWGNLCYYFSSSSQTPLGLPSN